MSLPSGPLPRASSSHIRRIGVGVVGAVPSVPLSDIQSWTKGQGGRKSGAMQRGRDLALVKSLLVFYFISHN